MEKTLSSVSRTFFPFFTFEKLDKWTLHSTPSAHESVLIFSRPLAPRAQWVQLLHLFPLVSGRAVAYVATCGYS